MLVLVTHQVEEVTAKVPLSTIMLLDHVKRKDVPDSLKPRLVLPTTGQTSISVWDVPSVETLQMWLDGVLGSYCKNEVIEVQEDFVYGLSVELARQRTTEKVSANTRQAVGVVAERTRDAAKAVASRTNQAWDQVDERLKITQRTSTAVKAVKSGSQAAVSKTSQFLHRMTSTNASSNSSGDPGAHSATQPLAQEMGSSVVVPPPTTSSDPSPAEQPMVEKTNYSLGEEEELLSKN
eukprot:TRINITY_DN201_c0_g1_i4.p1 TRINITY_DN201_c0_g1~~TRINITY_DN201_c0_g1_i4.p1  ORF type:complete len:236 (-),score=34.47 TRINITY_DN201_c0_g1_i4:310-1017(-)